MRAISPPGGPATHLSAERRAREVTELAEGAPLDLVVIGGGVSGAGAALDAATRGLSVALIERGDLASGTSSRSSKLIHGGLRYLAHGELGIAWESARERALLMKAIAPHLIAPVAQVTPHLTGAGALSKPALVVGMRIGDVLRVLAGSSSAQLPGSRRISRQEATALLPALARDRLRGALLSFDGLLEDDARLVVALARTAAGYGARIITYCEALRIGGAGVTVRERLSGDCFELRARGVLNATGVWAGGLVAGLALRPSRGAHLLIESARLGHPRAMLNVLVPGDFGRAVFACPRPDGLVLVGTTDERHAGSLDCVQVTPAEEEYLLDTLSLALERPLEGGAVVGRYAGLRPLVDSGASRTADLSRRHLVVEDPSSGALSMVGGKLTTYRAMAQQALDLICARGGVRAAECRTERLALVGAQAPVAGTRSGSPGAALPPRLLRRFGAEAAELAAAAGQGRRALLEPIAPGVPVLGIELLAGVRREGALCADDVIERRVGAGAIEHWAQAARQAIARLAPELPSRIATRAR